MFPVLVVPPPVLPMLAKRVDTMPEGDGWIFEPKWDGFRALVFRDHEELTIQSRDGKKLNRYFPELDGPLLTLPADQCVLDGEIVIANEAGLDFEALQLRVHPAASRVKLLAKESPASIVFWDLLCAGERDLRGLPFHARRRELEGLLANARPPIHLTPATRDRGVAVDWFGRFEGAGLDGVMAKAASGTYEANKRSMLKVKHERDCDCVVAGFRWHKRGAGTEVGSLLLGLYDVGGLLHHVGVTASFTAEKRRALVAHVAPYREAALRAHPWRHWAGGDREAEDEPQDEGQAQHEAHRVPGAKSRWSQGKDLSWEPLRPELVAQVAYDHMQGRRFRHTAQFRRWRLDKAPRDCTFAELDVVAPQELGAIFGGRVST